MRPDVSVIGGQKRMRVLAHGWRDFKFRFCLKIKIFHRTFEFKSCKLSYELIMKTYNGKTDLTDTRVALISLHWTAMRA